MASKDFIIHKRGTDDSWHGKVSEDGQFKPEACRYHMYIGKLSSCHAKVNYE